MRWVHSLPTPSHRISINSTNDERFVGIRLVFRHWCPGRNMAENSIVLATVANCCVVCRPHCCAIVLHVFPALALFVPVLLVVSVRHRITQEMIANRKRTHRNAHETKAKMWERKQKSKSKRKIDKGENRSSSKLKHSTMGNYLYKNTFKKKSQWQWLFRLYCDDSIKHSALTRSLALSLCHCAWCTGMTHL